MSWSPTHTVVAAGTSAWAQPDPAQPPVARLDPWLPVQVGGTAGGWAQVVCSNGWTAWVDVRALTSLGAAATPASAPAAAPAVSPAPVPAATPDVGAAASPAGATAGTEAASAWHATHRIPAAGIACRDRPDPTAEVMATLTPGLAVETVERVDGWGRVRCANGWLAWVDARLLEPLAQG